MVEWCKMTGGKAQINKRLFNQNAWKQNPTTGI